VSGDVFGGSENAVRILDRDGAEIAAAEGSKTLVAHRVLDELVDRLPPVR
jgi:phosphopantothenoylcysteine decarboxylase/phosphopantothenate--cysteine ligase